MVSNNNPNTSFFLLPKDSAINVYLIERKLWRTILNIVNEDDSLGVLRQPNIPPYSADTSETTLFHFSSSHHVSPHFYESIESKPVKLP